MVTTKSRGKLLFYALIFIVLLFGFINFLLLMGRRSFNLEFVGFFVLLFLMIVGFVGYNRGWGERFFFFFFVFYLANLIGIWYFFGKLYIILLFFGAIGFLLSVPSRSCGCCHEEELFEVPEQEPEVVENATPPPEKETAAKSTTAKHSPGKFVASKRSNLYHAPKCEWAKKIKKERRVWFKSKEDAWEQGYKAHACAK